MNPQKHTTPTHTKPQTRTHEQWSQQHLCVVIRLLPHLSVPDISKNHLSHHYFEIIVDLLLDLTF